MEGEGCGAGMEKGRNRRGDKAKLLPRPLLLSLNIWVSLLILTIAPEGMLSGACYLAPPS